MIVSATNEAVEHVYNFMHLPVPWENIDLDCTFAIEIDGEIGCVGGVTELWPGMGQGWSVTVPHVVEGHALQLTREVRKVMLAAIKKKGYRQVMSICFTNKDIRWNELLGYELMNVWPEAGPQGQDAFVAIYYRRN